MSVIQYDASTPGGQLTATTVARLIHTFDDLQHLKDLMDEVGNKGGSFSAANFEAANNDRFGIHAGEGQAAYDTISALNTACQAMLAADGNEARLASLYQAD